MRVCGLRHGVAGREGLRRGGLAGWVGHGLGPSIGGFTRRLSGPWTTQTATKHGIHRRVPSPRLLSCSHILHPCAVCMYRLSFRPL
mgnify:CR=1 FL=1